MKNIGFKILYLIAAIIIFTDVGFAVKGSLFSDITDLPTGTLQNTFSSPSEEKVMNVYVVKNNLGNAIRVEIMDEGNSHNIFWQTGIDTIDAVWLDNETVMINQIPLNVNDTFGYDCRRGYSLFDEGSLEQNFTSYEEK